MTEGAAQEAAPSARGWSRGAGMLALCLGGIGFLTGAVQLVSGKGTLNSLGVLVNSVVLLSSGVWSYRNAAGGLFVLAALVCSNALLALAAVAGAGALGSPFAQGYLAGTFGVAGFFVTAFVRRARQDARGRDAVWVLSVLLLMTLLEMAVAGLLAFLFPANAALVIAGATIVTGVGAAVGWKWRQGNLDLGWSPPLAWRVWGACVVSALILGWVAARYGDALVYAFGPSALEATHWIEELSRTERVVLLVILAPVAEEVLFRGVFQEVLRGVWGAPSAVLATALAFAVAHAMPAALPLLFVVGLTLGLARHYSGSILPGVVFHMLYNAMVVL